MRTSLLLVVIFFLTLVGPDPVGASEGWEQPPEPIGTILDRPAAPSVRLSPNGAWMVQLERPALRPIAELADPMLALAGQRISPRTNGRWRASYYTGMALEPLLAAGEPTPVALPDGTRITGVSWSPAGTYLSFTAVEDQGTSLWVLELASGEARQLLGPELNATYGRPCDWLAGDVGLVCKVVPEDRGPAPTLDPVPSGPLVEENLGRATPARTYANLLQSPHDEALLDHYFTSAIDLIGLDGSRERLIEPAVIDEITPSPDGRWLLSIELERPYSYHVPLRRFARRIRVLNRDGTEAFEVAELGLADEVPISYGSVRTGRRWVRWRSDQPASLVWVEALDGGDAGAEAEWRDALSQLDAPFDGEPVELWRTPLRFGEVLWGRDDAAIVSDWWYTTRQTRTSLIDPSQPGSEARTLVDRNYQDQYADPGDPLMELGPYGRWVLQFSPGGDALYVEGKGASPEGVYPFLDRLELATGETRRLWQCEDPYYERVARLLDPARGHLLTRRQSKEQPSNMYQRWINPDPAPGENVRRRRRRPRAVTAFPDPAPELAGIQKEVITYTRADGIELSASLYLPPGHDVERDGPLPTLLWAYPREHKSARTASQNTTATNTFSRPRWLSALFMLTQGWAVLSGPRMPIVGEGDAEPNDSYVDQLVAGAEAAVAAVVERGVADPDRVAIGGHSYGAFTVANLLAHTDLFRAGIARSGAYNRSLTPFGFQGEQRSYWEATDTYLEMSPFTHAADIDEPILLIHGAVDTNSGTWPMQSERLYEALKGLGGTARWVVLPLEDHGYYSREAVGHVHWEQVSWLNNYVRDAGPRAAEGASEDEAAPAE